MKKFFGVLLGALLTVGLASCGGPDFSKVWTDPSVQGYVLCGPSQNLVGENPLEWAYNENNVMTACSLNDVKAEGGEELANKFAGCSLKGLYMVKNVTIGATAAGYTKVGYKADGSLVMGDGALTIKICSFATDEETGTTAVQTWFPSPEGYSASFTPTTFQEQIHSDTPDANGLDHNSDVLVLGGAGNYTLFFAHFDKQVAANDGKMVSYAYAAVCKTPNPDGCKVEPIVPTPISSIGAIGSFAGSGWSTDVPLTYDGSTKQYSGTITVAAGDSFKVRANGDWTYNWGIGDATLALEFTADGDGNFVAPTEGVVQINIKLPESLSPIANKPTAYEVYYLA